MRPRRSQARSATVMRIPATSVKVSERNTKPSGDRRTAVRTRRSRVPATPSRRSSGEIDIPSRARPRSSGMRRTSLGRLGISPSTSEPSRPANAKNRSLAITTPSGLAIPPSSGSETESARARTAAGVAPCTVVGCRTARPPGKGRAVLFQLAQGPCPYQRPRAEEAEEQQDEHDDQDDPENAHAGHPLSGLKHVIPRPRRSETAR